MDLETLIQFLNDFALFKHKVLSYICICILAFILFMWQLYQKKRTQDIQHLSMNGDTVMKSDEISTKISPISSSPLEKHPLMEIYEAAIKSDTQFYVDRCIELLKCYPEFVNIPATGSRFTPFLRACWTGNHLLVSFMLQHGADISTRTDAGESPFYLAVHRTSKLKDTWDPTLINLLYKSGCEVNARKLHGYTTLHLAAKSGHVALVRWLLVHGADPEQITDCGMKPVDIASQLGYLELVKLLTLRIKDSSHLCTPYPRKRIGSARSASTITTKSTQNVKGHLQILDKSC